MPLAIKVYVHRFDRSYFRFVLAMGVGLESKTKRPLTRLPPRVARARLNYLSAFREIDADDRIRGRTGPEGIAISLCNPKKPVPSREGFDLIIEELIIEE